MLQGSTALPSGTGFHSDFSLEMTYRSTFILSNSRCVCLLWSLISPTEAAAIVPNIILRARAMLSCPTSHRSIRRVKGIATAFDAKYLGISSRKIGSSQGDYHGTPKNQFQFDHFRNLQPGGRKSALNRFLEGDGDSTGSVEHSMPAFD